MKGNNVMINAIRRWKTSKYLEKECNNFFLFRA